MGLTFIFSSFIAMYRRMMIMIRQKPDLHHKDKGPFISHPHRNSMRFVQLVAVYDMQEDTMNSVIPLREVNV